MSFLSLGSTLKNLHLHFEMLTETLLLLQKEYSFHTDVFMLKVLNTCKCKEKNLQKEYSFYTNVFIFLRNRAFSEEEFESL